MIISVDDFYTMSNGLVMLQTTNNVFNTTLYDHVKPSSILAWQRVRIANMMAKGGKEWGHYFSLENSGKLSDKPVYVLIKLVYWFGVLSHWVKLVILGRKRKSNYTSGAIPRTRQWHSLFIDLRIKIAVS